MYERRTQPLLSRRVFYIRLSRSVIMSSAIILASLFIGMAGYHCFEKLPWLDAFTNASMILSGMGPLAPIQTSAGKIFAGCYALFSGIAFISSVGVIFAPIYHRFLHKFHFESK